MTTYNKASLAAFFETGDVPSGTNYSDFIDSYVNVAETSAQAMQGALSTTELITPRVSANNGVFTGTMRIDGLVSANNITMFGILSANTINSYGNSKLESLTVVSTISAASLNVTGDVSAATGTVYASAMRSVAGVFAGVGIVSAAGTTQAAAAVLSNVINRGKGIADGVTTGFRPPANRTGLTQYLYNEGVSANLWPPVGGTINGLAVDAAFSLAASAMVTIVHLTASAMAVK